LSIGGTLVVERLDIAMMATVRAFGIPIGTEGLPTGWAAEMI